MRLFQRTSVLLLCFSLAITAEAKKIKGNIIFEDDTIRVTLIIPMYGDTPYYARLQNKIKYIDKQGQKQVLKPHEAKEVSFHYGKKIRLISVEKTNHSLKDFVSTSSHIFYKLEIDGKLRLFKHYTLRMVPSQNAGPSSQSIDTMGLLKKEGEPVFSPPTFEFRQSICEYLSDCPAVVEEINNKRYKWKNLRTIVKYYNTHCGE